MTCRHLAGLASRPARFTVALVLACFMPGLAVGSDCQDYDGGMRWLSHLSFSFSGDSDIAFKGNTAYVAMNKVKLVNVSDPEAPYQFGELTAGYANPRRVEANDQLLVASVYTYGIEVYGIAQAGNPQFRVRYQTPTPALDVCLSGDLCYVGCEDIGVLILDLADPQQPVELGTVGSGDGRRVARQGGYLYAAEAGALVVYDLANPTHPAETYRWGNAVIDAVPSGDRLYLGMALNGFAVFDLDSPAYPTAVGTQNPGSFTMSANGFGDYVFPLYSSWSQIECYAAAGSPPWPLVDSIDTDFGPDVLKFHGDLAFAPGSYGLDIFDLRQPEGGAELLGYLENFDEAVMRAVVSRDGFAYVNNDGDVIGETYVQVIDVRDPAAPQLLKTLPYLDSVPLDFALGDSLLYVADLTGVDIVDISFPPGAERVARVDTEGSANQVELAGSWLFVAGGSAGLQVADLSLDPAAPVFVAGLPLSDDAVALAVAANLAAVILADGTLAIVDIADPTAPAFLGELGGNYFAENVALQGEVAYVDGDDMVFAVSLADPTAPTVIGSVAVPGSAHDVAVAGSTLYVTAHTAGLQVVDVSDPTEPVLIGSLALEHLSYGITIAKGIVHVASDSRLNLAPLHCEPITGIDGETATPAAAIALGAYPNPFNPATRIRFELTGPDRVDLAIFDAAGRRVRTLLDGEPTGAGTHVFHWDGRADDGRALPSGVYLVRLRAGSHRVTGKLALLR